MDAPSRKSRRSRLTAPERRRQIVEAALDEFANAGFGGARTRAIAQRAGVSETLVFQHFADKEALYAAALEHLFHGHPVFADVQQAMERRDDRAVLMLLAHHILQHTSKDPRIIRLGLFSALDGRPFGRSATDREAHPEPFQLLARYLRTRVDEGVFRAVDTHSAALLFVEALYMHAADRLVAISTAEPVSVPVDQVVETLVQVFLGGLRAG